MQLAHIDVLRADTGLLVDLAHGGVGHVGANPIEQRRLFEVEGFRGVGGHRLGDDFHVAAQAMLFRKTLGHQDRRGTTAGWRARHQAGHDAWQNHRVVHHVFDAEHLAKQCKRVVGGMTAGLGAHSGEGFHSGAVFLYVFAPGTTEGTDGLSHAIHIGGKTTQDRQETFAGRRAVVPMGFQRTGLHLLETHRQYAIYRAGFDGLARQVQRGGAGRAVVVDVDHRDPGHADFVEHRLAAGGIAVDVTGVSLLDQVVIDRRIGQGATHRFGAHLHIGRALAGLAERDHADAGNQYFFAHGVT
ncbi:hypothetical protein D3C81_1326210 [compost metagenome]